MRADDGIWKRLLPEPGHVVVCDLYHLKAFLGAAKGRRERYYKAVADGPATLTQALGIAPTEQDVLSWIAFVLGHDRTFLAHVSKHGGAEPVLDADRWRLVLQAGAGAIIGEYLIAHDNGDLI